MGFYVELRLSLPGSKSPSHRVCCVLCVYGTFSQKHNYKYMAK